jgi:hypothetical protein
MNREMILIQRQFEVFKDITDSHQEFERFRQYILKKYPRSDEAFEKQIQASISTIAELAPLMALNLEGIVNRYWFLQEAKLSETAKDHELYIYQLSSLELGFDLYQKEMEKALRKLAFMHGFKTWAQFMLESKRMKKNNPRESDAFNKLLTQFRQAKEKYSEINNSPSKEHSADAEEQRG